MAALRWGAVALLALAFAMMAAANWQVVPFHLPDGAVLPIRLPLLLGLAILAGWLPTWTWYRLTTARLRRRLASSEVTSSVPSRSPLPSQAQPTIVPPAGA